MAANSTTDPAPSQPGPAKRTTPKKPYPEFPLSAHPNGQWAKWIKPFDAPKRKLYYFGPWADAPAAIERYKAEIDDIMAGRDPAARAALAGGLAVADGLGHFLDAKERARDRGDISAKTWRNYRETCEKMTTLWGPGRLLESLSDLDFLDLLDAFHTRSKKSRHTGPVSPRTVAGQINNVKTAFNYLQEAGHLEKVVRYGPDFKVPKKSRVREYDRETLEGNKKRMFSADEIRRLLDLAPLDLRAMILLGINCGFGCHDCGTLLLDAVDLDAGWVDHPRPKTGNPRRAALWPETVDALHDTLDRRPKPASGEPDDRFFVTRTGGTYETRPNYCPVSARFAVLLNTAGFHRRRSGFYWLRHGFETIGGDSTDQIATNYIMGHCGDDTASIYREDVFDPRIRKVTDHVRAWLFGFTPASPEDDPVDEEPRILKFRAAV